MCVASERRPCVRSRGSPKFEPTTRTDPSPKHTHTNPASKPFRCERQVATAALEDRDLATPGCGSKSNRRGYTGFGPCFHFPGFHFGTGLLSHSYLMPHVLKDACVCRGCRNSLPRGARDRGHALDTAVLRSVFLSCVGGCAPCNVSCSARNGGRQKGLGRTIQPQQLLAEMGCLCFLRECSGLRRLAAEGPIMLRQ